MQRIENDCVDCGKPCFSSCPYKEVLHLYCDNCGGEVTKLYCTDGEELCIDCLHEQAEQQAEVISIE